MIPRLIPPASEEIVSESTAVTLSSPEVSETLEFPLILAVVATLTVLDTPAPYSGRVTVLLLAETDPATATVFRLTVSPDCGPEVASTVMFPFRMETVDPCTSARLTPPEI